MEVINLHLDRLLEAPWNPNTMTPAMREKLRNSIARYGLVENLVVRPLGDNFEVLSGNQRLSVYRDLCINTAPCVVVDLDDTQALLLAQVRFPWLNIPCGAFLLPGHWLTDIEKTSVLS